MKAIAATGLLSLLTLASDGGELRVFTDTEGRAVQGKVVDFNHTGKLVQIEREDGKRVWVQPERFSESDRQYIAEWVAADRILSDENLRFTIRKKKGDSFKEGMGDQNLNITTARKGEIVRYEVTVQNRTDTPIANLKLEYRYFVVTEDKQTDRETLTRSSPETQTIRKLHARGAETFTTRDITLVEEFRRVAVMDRRLGVGVNVGYELREASEEHLEGLWIRVYGPPAGGKPTFRDIGEPDDLIEDYTWEGNP